MGDVAPYEDAYRLCYVRGPEGIVVGLAEQLGIGVGDPVAAADQGSQGVQRPVVRCSGARPRLPAASRTSIALRQ